MFFFFFGSGLRQHEILFNYSIFNLFPAFILKIKFNCLNYKNAGCHIKLSIAIALTTEGNQLNSIQSSSSVITSCSDETFMAPHKTARY